MLKLDRPWQEAIMKDVSAIVTASGVTVPRHRGRS